MSVSFLTKNLHLATHLRESPEELFPIAEDIPLTSPWA